MWKYNNRVIKLGRAWSDGFGNQYPSNWLSLTTNEEKKAVGLVWEDDPAPYDRRFFISATTPKAIDDVTDDNGVVIEGLKTAWKKKTKAMAKSLLEPTDWYVVRKAEDSTTTIPTNVATYRAAVRTASGTIETAITNASSHSAFMALFDVPVDSDGNPTGKAPINNWPDPLD